jgi:hypothetical protein
VHARFDKEGEKADRLESESRKKSFSSKLGRNFFMSLFVAISFLFSFIIFWQASTELQKNQTRLFIQQALQGNVDFSILLKAEFQALDGLGFPWKEIKEDAGVFVHKETEEKGNSVSPPRKVVSSSEKYRNLYSCKKRTSMELAKKKLFQWKNGVGQVHLSDRLPQSKDYHDLRVRDLKSENFFSLKLDSRYSSLPAFASDRIKRDVNHIYKILTKRVGVSQLHPVVLNLRLFDDRDRFRLYKEKVAPGLGVVGGFYTARLNEAGVYTGNNDARMYSVTRHEAVHAIVNGAFGRIPTWLNEGLAEYFERLSFENGMSRIVRSSKGHLSILSKGRLPSLTSFFSIPNHKWYDEPKKSEHYALAWSLVYFLMSTQESRRFLSYMLDYLAFNYCQPFSDINYIEKNYTGGLQGLEQNWRKWLAGPKRNHRY